MRHTALSCIFIENDIDLSKDILLVPWFPRLLRILNNYLTPDTNRQKKWY